jgi:hypothetical protein
MKQNRISPDVNHSSMDVPIWTIPISGVRNDNEDLPSYNHFIASQFDNVPPNYFDISIIPKGAVLHYSDIIPYREASKAKIKRKNGGVFSIDPLIDKNPDQLWLYFMTYLNEKPRLIVNILGHHVEVRHIFKQSIRNSFLILFLLNSIIRTMISIIIVLIHMHLEILSVLVLLLILIIQLI